MSTAAQMARRKIATPKSRTGRSTTPTMSSNPFQSQSQSQQSSAFQFGSNVNQSFPPPNQSSQSFQFNVPGASSSFTFGQSGNQSQPISNPFANANGNSDNYHSDQNEMQDSTPEQSQPVQSSSIFNFAASQPATSSGTNGFNFGQSTQKTNGAFGSSVFGQQNTQNQSNNVGLFGSTPQPQQNGFTPLFGSSNQGSSASLFSSTTAPSAPSFSGFGGASSTPSSTPTATFSFGQTSNAQPNQSQPSDPIDKPKKLFDFGTSQSESTSTSKPSFSFGQPTPIPNQSESQSTPKPTFTGFGLPSNAKDTPGTTSSSLFAGFGTTSTAAESPKVQQSSNVFGGLTGSGADKNGTQASDPGKDQETPKNPFSSLFKGAGVESDTTTQSAKPIKAPFQFGQSTLVPPSTMALPNEGSKSIAKPTDQSSPQTDSTNQPSIFKFNQSGTSSGGLFSPKPSTSGPSTGLFNLNKPTPSAQPDNTNNLTQENTSNSEPLFGFAPQKPLEVSSSSAPSTSNIFGLSTQATSSPLGEKSRSDIESESPPKKRLFQGTSTPAAMAQSAFSSLSGSKPPAANSADKESQNLKPKSPTSIETFQEPVTRAVSTEGPPQIPRFLSAEKYKVYDESWRLKALNRRFKSVINDLDPEKHDFMNIIQNYLDHRESIGEGLGGYERKKSAGTKRKAIDVDHLEEDEVQGKRAKPVNAPSAPSVINNFTSSPSKNSVSNADIGSSNVAPSKPISFTPAKTVEDTEASNVFRSMIPGATASASTALPNAKSTTPPSSPPKPAASQLPRFEVPKFGGGGGMNFMNAFAKSSAANAIKFEQEAKEKRKAEEFDSDEDDEEAWEKKYQEEQRAKKAKIEAAAKKGLAVPAFIPSASSSRSNSPFTFGQPIKSIETNGSKSPEPSSQSGVGTSKSSAIEIESGEDSTGQESGNSGDDEADQGEDEEQQNEDGQDADDDEEEEEEEEEEEASPPPDLPHKDSLFSRVSGGPASRKPDEPILQPATNNSFKPGLMFGNIGKGTPEPPGFSPFTPSTTNSLPKGDFVPTTKFNFTPTTVTSSSSIFSSSMLGGPLKDGPIPGEGLFGSRPSTPSNAETNKPFAGFSFGATGSKQTTDNTYKQGTPIKFGASTNDSSAPSVEVTAATPPAKEQSKPFAGLFGQSSSNTSTNSASLGFNFGSPSTSTQPAPGFLSAAAHLGGASAPSSRATSPGIPSEAESVATDNTEDYSQEPQTSLMSSNNGEENDEILYESRAIISRMYKESEIPEKSKIVKGWNKMGTGVVKVLKDKTSSKTRIVFRAEPGANVILNTRLISGGTYQSQAAGKGGAVTFPVATDNGMQMWMIRVKTLENAQEAAKAMETNKKN